MKKKKGFTLIEFLLSLALVTVLLGFAVPFYQSFRFGTELEIAVDETSRAIRSAQVFATEGKNSSNWGVYIQSGTITVYSGDDYSTRDTLYDYGYEISTQLEVSGTNEFNFELGTGNALLNGTVNYTFNNRTNTVEVNEKGGLTFN